MAGQSRMIAKGKGVVGEDDSNTEHVDQGSKRWFRDIEGLNNVGYILGVEGC
jgi:hypothetical protein